MRTRRTADWEGSTRSGVQGARRTVIPHIARRFKHGVQTEPSEAALPQAQPTVSHSQLAPSEHSRVFRRVHGVISARDKDNFRRK